MELPKILVINCATLPESATSGNYCLECDPKQEKKNIGKFVKTRQGGQFLIICKCGFIMIPWGFEKEQILHNANLRNP